MCFKTQISFSFWKLAIIDMVLCVAFLDSPETLTISVEPFDSITEIELTLNNLLLEGNPFVRLYSIEYDKSLQCIFT